MPRPSRNGETAALLVDLRTKDKLLASMHKISSLLTRPIPLDRILTAIVRETCLVFGFTRMAVFLANPARTLLECRYIHGFNARDSERAFRLPYRLLDQDCVETRVARHGRALYVRDYPTDPRATAIDLVVSRIMGRVSTIAVPLKIKRAVIGLITADKGPEALKLGRKDIDALATFANQASIVIENARLQAQNQHTIRRLLTLQEASKRASTAFDRKRLVQTICTSGRKLTGASGCSLYLARNGDGALALAVSRGCCRDHDRRLQGVDRDPLIAWVATSGQPALVTDTTRDERCQGASPAGSRLAVPLPSEKRVAGVLAVHSPLQNAFSEDDLKLLLIFADHTASLLRNVRLYGQVRTERNFRENILESSPNSIITFDLRKQVSSVNRRAEEMFARPRDQLLGRPSAEVFGEAIAAIVDQAIDHRAVVSNREIAAGASSFGVTSSLLKDHREGLLGAMELVRDLTEEKKTDELIRRIDRVTSLGQLSAGIAHEIRNPLASISFNVQLLAKRLVADPEAGGLIADTRAGIDRIRSLVQSMLDFARPAPPRLQRGSMVRALREAAALMHSQLHKNRVAIRLDLPADLPLVVFDAHQLQQVFVNLVLNGMQAMPGGGQIVIDGGVEPADDGFGRCLLLRFTDHGCGIAPDQLARIFNPFFTTKAEGTGLGLSIVHKILEQHNATVEVVSEAGQGTSFLLRFPLDRNGGDPCSGNGY
ncbi:MAG: GAF domain-containing protein [Desulfobulbus sp.]|jgi:PAS domain S-box-containing protein|nr:GAF domain-containing protein [Desulfobulbus sp.]